MKILSWNVNGVRAVQKKGFLDWLQVESPDILGLQETKAHPEQLDIFLLNPPGYHTYWSRPEKKGYSGVAILSKEKPKNVSFGYEGARFDSEGRVVRADYDDFTFLSIYFPNGKAREERLQYKLDFYAETMTYIKKLKKKQPRIIISGDYNTAHKEIDLARPKENADVSGFLPIERAWLDDWVNAGHVDIFRKFNQESNQYTWWDMKSFARERNVGWRIDYHFVTEALADDVKSAWNMTEKTGSDHCPIAIELKS